MMFVSVVPSPYLRFRGISRDWPWQKGLETNPELLNPDNAFYAYHVPALCFDVRRGE